MNKKSMELKVLLVWLVILITMVVLLFFIRAAGSHSSGIMDAIFGAWR